MKRRILLLVCALATACGGGGSDGGGGPAPPAENDPAFVVSGAPAYLLAGDALTPAVNELRLRVETPEGVSGVDVWIDGVLKGSLEVGDAAFLGAIDVGELAIGGHDLVLAEPGADEGFAFYPFERGHAIYVLVTTDWDDADNDDASLRLQEMLHTNHPELKLTHFVGPYTFTDAGVTPERRTILADWVKGMRDDHDDEIGLHIHAWCSFISTSGVPCRTTPSISNADGDETGYSVIFSTYTEEELVQIFARADEIFAEQGLGKPTSFRTGGWAAEANVLKALVRAGFVADTSAVNWARIEEWEQYEALGAQLYSWLMTHWTPQGDTNQPYYPGEADINQPGSPTIPILEVPDNGALVDYVSSDEMIQIFTANYPGQGLPEPRQFSIGFHPPNFHTDATYFPRMDMVMTHLDGLLASEQRGGVVYATLSDMATVWPVP